MFLFAGTSRQRTYYLQVFICYRGLHFIEWGQICNLGDWGGRQEMLPSQEESWPLPFFVLYQAIKIIKQQQQNTHQNTKCINIPFLQTYLNTEVFTQWFSPNELGSHPMVRNYTGRPCINEAEGVASALRDQFGSCIITTFKLSTNIFIHESAFLRVRAWAPVFLVHSAATLITKPSRYLSGLQSAPISLEPRVLYKCKSLALIKEHPVTPQLPPTDSKNQRSALLWARAPLPMVPVDGVDICPPQSDLIISDPYILAGFASSRPLVL